MRSTSGRSADYANVLQTLIQSVSLLQEATESTNLPLPSGPLAGVAIDRLEAIKTLKANQDVGEELAEKIVHQVGTIYHELARPTTNENDAPHLTQASVTRYTKALTDAQDTLIRLSQRGRLGQSLLRGKDRKELISVMSAVDKEFTSFMETLGREQNPTREHRRSLHITPAALQDFASPAVPGRPASPLSANEVPLSGQQQQQSYCWPGTRIPILDEIDHWATSTITAHGTPGASINTSLIYWLADIPGSGKSAIAASLVEEWRSKSILGGFYDFGTSNVVRVPEETGEGLVPGVGAITDALCEVWATQLGSAFPELSSPILRALSDIHRSPPSSSSRSFSNQLKLLILDPLKTLQRARYDLQPHTKILFVLDSIDECPPPHRTAILQAIKSVSASRGGVKFFLISGLPTSEADNDISVELLECPASLATRGSINIHSASNMADILLYLTSQFQVHAAQFHSHSQFRTALIEPTIRVLAKRAEGLILWARLAFEMLLVAENPTRMLLNLVEEDALSDVRGLYLEIMLTAQYNLDILNELRAPYSAPKEETGNRVEEPSTSTGPSMLVAVPRVPEAFPKNALAAVVSAVAYATEMLSVAAIAELTGLGLERTVIILDLLTSILDHSYSSTGRSTSQPHVALTSSSRVNLVTGNAVSASPLKPRKRSASTPRKSSFSPPRKVSRPLSSHGIPRFMHSPMSANFASTSGGAGRPSSDLMNQQGQDSASSNSRSLQAPSKGNTTLAVPFPLTPHSGRGGATGRTVRIRHATFREWVHLPHPPTLLSCLTGKGSAEEDDLRFLIAPSREGAHAMLAKGCFGIIRTTSLTPQQLEDRDRAGATEGSSDDGAKGSDAGDASEDEMVSYACRYWAHHCAEMLSSLTATRQRSEIYMSISSTVGPRWKAIRGDMLEFFTRKLLWWVDTSIALNCVPQGTRGLNGLRDILENMSPEENLKAAVNQLIQWISESIALLDNPQGFPEDERDPETSIVHKYYGEELARRAALAERQRVELAERQRAELTEHESAQHPLSLLSASEKLSPVPTVPEHDIVPSMVKTASSQHSAPSEIADSVGNTGSAFTGTTSVSTDDAGSSSGKEGLSGNHPVVGSSKEEKGLPQTPVIGQNPSDPQQFPLAQESDSQTATNGTSTPVVHEAISAEPKNPSAPLVISIKTKDLPAPPTEAQHSSPSTPHDAKIESKDDPTIRPSPNPNPPSAGQNRGYPTAPATQLFPGLAFFQNASQQSLVSPVSGSSEPSKRDNSPSAESTKRKDSIPPSNAGGVAVPTPVVPTSDQEKRPGSSNRKSPATASTKSNNAAGVSSSFPPPATPSPKQAKRPEASNRKSSKAESTKSTLEPEKSIPPPPPAIMMSTSSSGGPMLSTGDLGSELGDILNIINFDNPTPISLSSPPGATGATRETGVN